MRNLVALSLSVFGVGQAAFGAATPSAASPIAPYIPLVLIFAIFYFLMIRPQQKKAKEQQKFLSELKKGDMIVTASGIIGMIKALSDRFVTLEIDEGVCLKVLRNQVLESANSIKDAKPA
jgi:preprotein translocase subunit YajC